MSLRTLFVCLSLVVVANAFAPNHHVPFGVKSRSALRMKFLKDLGFEKPSWLPDFGGEKKEEKPAKEEEKTEEPAAAAEGEAAPAEE